MGQSTDAMLMFGSPISEWDDSYEFPDEFQETDLYKSFLDWKILKNEEFYLEHPEYEYSKLSDDELSIGELDEYFEKQHPKYTIERHCSSECPMWILGQRNTRKRAWRGDPKDVNFICAPDFSGRYWLNDAKENLIAFAEKHGIPIDGDPVWLLFSDWC